MKWWEEPEYVEERERRKEILYRSYEKLMKGPFKDLKIDFIEVKVAPLDPYETPKMDKLPYAPQYVRVFTEICKCDKVKYGPTVVFLITPESENEGDVFIEDYFSDADECEKCEKEEEAFNKAFKLLDSLDDDFLKFYDSDRRRNYSP